jgi:hypothetical protein
VLGENSPADDSYLAAGMLRVAVSSARQGDPGQWLRILSAKLAGLIDPPVAFQFRRLEAIGGLALEAGAPALQLLVVAVRDVAGIAREAGVTVEARVQALRRVPAPLAGRLIAWHLSETVEADSTLAVAVIAGEVAEHAPMPETLALLRSLTERGVDGLVEAMSHSLGEPPTEAELAAAIDPEDLPAPWRRAYGWLDAMPGEIKEAWAAANARVQARWGPALPEGHVWPAPQGHWVQVTSPAEVDELAEMSPLDAARQVAAWRPETDRYSGPSARGLAGALRKAIDANPAPWLAADPSEMVRTLRHPTYVAEYLGAVGEHADAASAHARALVDAVELVQQEPWPVEDLGGDGYDHDQSWGTAAHAGVELLGKLAAAGADFGGDRDRAWQVIVRATRDRVEPSVFAEDQEVRPLDHAVNRSSMRSLSVAFVFAESTCDPAREPEQLLELLDEALALGRPDGLHARAMLARPLPWLVERAPGWTQSRWERIVGDQAPEGLGADTFDLYLEWGDPYRTVLAANRERFAAAMQRAPEHARRHLLTAMLWGVDGYDPGAVFEMIKAAGDGEISEAAQWLAFSAARSPEMPMRPAIEFWESALRQDLPAAAYEGFGWLSRATQLDADVWLELLLAAAGKARGQLEQADHVATRAAEHAGDERAIRLVAALLDADLKLWFLEDVGRVGLEMLKSEDPATEDARAELREQLLSREFFDAYEEGDA